MVAYAAVEMADEDDELPAGLIFVEGFEGDFLPVLVLNLQLAGCLERLCIWQSVVGLVGVAVHRCVLPVRLPLCIVFGGVDTIPGLRI